MIEKKWIEVSKLFTTNGTAVGSFEVSDISGLKVKQQVEIKSSTNPTLYLEIKRIQFPKVYVGALNASILDRTDISAYLVADSASIHANEQARPGIDPKQSFRAVYEEEPAVAIRTIQVDENGNIIKGNAASGDVNVHDHLGNGIDSVSLGSKGYLDVNALITDGTDRLSVNADGSINVNIVTSVAGTPIIHKEIGSFTNTSETIVGTFTSVAINSFIYQLMGDSPTFGTWRMYKNSVNTLNLLAVTRTSEFAQNAQVYFYQYEKLSTIGDKIIVTFQAHRYRTPLLGASAATFVRLEGYY